MNMMSSKLTIRSGKVVSVWQRCVSLDKGRIGSKSGMKRTRTIASSERRKRACAAFGPRSFSSPRCSLSPPSLPVQIPRRLIEFKCPASDLCFGFVFAIPTDESPAANGLSVLSDSDKGEWFFKNKKEQLLMMVLGMLMTGVFFFYCNSFSVALRNLEVVFADIGESFRLWGEFG